MPPGDHPSPMDVVVRLWHCWNKKDYEAGMAYLADDVVLSSAAASWRQYRGHDGLRGWREELAANGIDTVSTPYEWEQHGPHVVVCGLMTIYMRGVEQEQTEVHWIFRFNGAGKVTHIGSFLDREAALAWLRD